jgi:hypothetical protein
VADDERNEEPGENTGEDAGYTEDYLQFVFTEIERKFP